MKLKELSKRKKIIGVSLIVAAVLAVGGGSVYAYNNYQEQQRMEAEQAAKEAEEKRLAEKAALIDAELDTLKGRVAALYTDDTEALLRDGLPQDEVMTLHDDLKDLSAVYDNDADISGDQLERLQLMWDSWSRAFEMYEIVQIYDWLFVDGQPALTEGLEYDQIVDQIMLKLDALKDIKPEFVKQYSKRTEEVKAVLDQMQEAVNSVDLLYDRETGAAISGVIREQYTLALELVNNVVNDKLKAELLGYLVIVDESLTASKGAAQNQQGEAQNAQMETKSSSENASKSSSSEKNSGSSSSSGSGSTKSSGSNDSSSSSSGSGSSASSGGNSSGSSDSGSSSSENSLRGSSESTRISSDYEYKGNPDGAGDVYGGSYEGSLY